MGELTITRHAAQVANLLSVRGSAFITDVRVTTQHQLAPDFPPPENQSKTAKSRYIPWSTALNREGQVVERPCKEGQVVEGLNGDYHLP